MADCIFCKIASGEIPCKLIFQNDDVIAFYDVNPVAPIHVLVIPRTHYKNLEDTFDVEPEIPTKLLLAIKQITKLLDIDEVGYRLILNSGENGGQTVPHLHFHIIAGKKLNNNLV